jgi:hypothetical protein
MSVGIVPSIPDASHSQAVGVDAATCKKIAEIHCYQR